MKKEEDVLKINFIPTKQNIKDDIDLYPLIENEQCPVCKSKVFLNGRCKTCFECGWSSCEI